MTQPGDEPSYGEFGPPALDRGGPVMTQDPRKRRRFPFGRLAAGLLMLVAFVPAAIGAVRFMTSVSALARVPLPAGGEVTLSHAGGNEIYYEPANCPPSSQPLAAFIPPVVLNISPASPGAAYSQLKPAGSTSSYSSGGRCGVSLGTVQITHPGRFRIWDSGPGSYVAGGHLAVGPGVTNDIWFGILLTIALGFVGVAIFVVFALRGVRRRLR